MEPMLLLVLALVLAAEFVNGWTDAPNAIATVVGTRVLSPRKAILLATTFNIVGTFCGTAVAATIGKDIVNASVIDLPTIAAAMLSIVLWSSVAAHYGLPTSESHALIAGLSGAALATAGPSVLLWVGWKKVFIGIACSTFLGLIPGLALAKILKRAFANCNPQKAKRVFGRLQIFSAGFMAFNHGLNDGQKFMGVFALSLVLGGMMPSFSIPWWVILACALTMGIGTSCGGYKIMGKLGIKMAHLETWQGFAAETSASLTILGASSFGIPISTTHTITTTIMGVGAARRFSAVRWSVVKDIALAWVFTFPICGLIAFLACLLLKFLF